MKRNLLNAAEEIAVERPVSLYRDRYEAGFAHALKGGNLDRIEHFKLSFREGFRAGKLHVRGLRRKQGIIEFPMRGRVKVRAV